MTTLTVRPWVQSTLVGAEHQILALNAGVVCEISRDYVEMVPLIVHHHNTYPLLVEALNELVAEQDQRNQMAEPGRQFCDSGGLVLARHALALAKKGETS